MSEMVERVARAICDGQGRSWGAADGHAHDRWRDLARAAIEALREPTQEMLDASYEWDKKVTATEPDPHARGTWRAMIDAALASEPKP